MTVPGPDAGTAQGPQTTGENSDSRRQRLEQIASIRKEWAGCSDRTGEDWIKLVEEGHVRARRLLLGLSEKTSRTGLALSGGGIRSATFSLGEK